MGQHSVVQRVGSEVALDVPLTYNIDSDTRSGIRGVVYVPKDWLERRRVGPGVYLVSVTDGSSVVRFFAEYRPDASDVSWWYRRVPRQFATVFEDKSLVWLTLQRFDVSDFVGSVREGILRRFANLSGFQVVDGKVVFQVSGKELSFPIVRFGYQASMRRTGALVVFSGSGHEEDALRIFSTGYGEPDLYFRAHGEYRPVNTISYENDVLRVQYRHEGSTKPLREVFVDLRVINLKWHSSEVATQQARVMETIVQEYHQASSSRERNRMGAIGTSAVAGILEELGYKIVRADTRTGTMKGPDIVALDSEGNYVIVEVKSTSVSERLEETFKDAQDTIRTKYLDLDSGFIWWQGKTVNNAPRAIAVAVYPDAREKMVLSYAKELRFEISEGEKRIIEKEFRLQRQQEGV